VEAPITGGVISDSLCSMTAKYNYCDKTKGAVALIVLCIIACGINTMTIAHPYLQVGTHVFSAVCGLVAMALWVSVQTDMNKDTASYNTINLDYCAGVVIFSWLLNAACAILVMWGSRFGAVSPLSAASHA
jgi:hypothetical protein